MKELSTVQKTKVIKLYLSGETFDEIAVKAGVSKGSVVNIINDFREGLLPIPPGMVELVDEVRKLVVDLKKNDTTVPQLKNYMKIHSKLKELGVSIEKMDTWLDICQDIATPSVSNKEFVRSSIELAQQTKKSGLNYQEILADYHEKQEALNSLDEVISQKNEEEEKAKLKLKEINAKKKLAENDYSKKKFEMDIKLKGYMDQHKLTLEKVDTVLNILDSSLPDSGLPPNDIEKLKQAIKHAGSLTIYNKNAENERSKWEKELALLKSECTQHAKDRAMLEYTNNELTALDKEKRETLALILEEIPKKHLLLGEMQRILASHYDLIQTTYWLLSFLTSPDKLSDKDIDGLTNMMVFIRQERLGMTPDKYKHVDGEIMYECKIPYPYFAKGLYKVNIDVARKKLAMCLVPLVKSKFMPISEWNMKQYTSTLSLLRPTTTGAKLTPT